MVSQKVYKKVSPNGKLTVYLEKRTLYDNTIKCEPVCGLIVVEDSFLNDRQVYAELVVTYQYGRGDTDAVFGIQFSREFILCQQHVYPAKKDKKAITTPMQRKLMNKFGPNAHPFTLDFTVNSPNSVILQDLDKEDDAPQVGVSYAVQSYVTEDDDMEPKESPSYVEMGIVKLQHALLITAPRLPMAWVSKGLAFGQGKLDLEVTLDREYFYHGEQIPVSIVIINDSSRCVQYVKCYVTQHTEVTMIDAKFDKQVASLETRDGFPIESGACLTKYIYLVPAMDNNSERFGLALDGHSKEDAPHLASTTMAAEGHFIESIGIVVSYSVTVEVDCGTFSGKLSTDVPFKLVNSVNKIGLCASPRNSRRNSSSLIKEEDCPGDPGVLFRGFRRTSINTLK